MITILSKQVSADGSSICDYIGLSTDTKPTGKLNGSHFFEMDTRKESYYNEEGDWIATATKYLVSIAVTTAPTKVEYDEGDNFDKTGMVVKATYTDNSTATITTYTVSPSTDLAVTDTSVTITYSENGITKTTTQAITVTSE